jgi:hypothetical protein
LTNLPPACKGEKMTKQQFDEVLMYLKAGG